MAESFGALMASHGLMIETLVELEGEITPEIEQYFANLLAKVDGVDSFRSALDAEEGFVAKRIDRLQNIRERIQKKKIEFDQYIINSMQAAGKVEVAGELVKLVLQNNPPSVVIENEALIPNGFMRMPAPPPPPKASPDKKAIGDALKAGQEVPGATLRRSVRLVAKENSILVKSKAAKQVTA